MDTVAKAVLETIGKAGYVVIVGADDVTAIDRKTDERFIVRHDPVRFFDAIVELAQQVGIDLEDG